ncbi:AfsA-related hotdog domain-containing protein [Streptomyces sp. MMG1121]|uniref:AfsA-related hotdog domain-containing protein n=1 Tax=Streptomyces sp. MMG1121 TaxID=1415544 RepID=UPI000A63EB26|nr:AfsA-related hotdog domain-containing protein [Streptomyces sp. MMG1121]
MTARQVHRAPADLDDPAAGFSPVNWEQVGEHEFVVRLRYRHGEWPLATAHAVRQAALLVAHEAYGVPRGDHCVFRSLSCTMTAGSPAPLEPGTETTLRLSCLQPDLRRGRLVGARFRGEPADGEPPAGRAEVDFAFLSPAVYRFVRGSGGGGEGAGESATGGREFRPAPEQLVFRGKPVDHIPGMVLAAAALDAAAGPDTTPTGLTCTFTGYTTPDEPVRLHLHDATATTAEKTVEVWALQSGRRVFEGTVLTG